MTSVAAALSHVQQLAPGFVRSLCGATRAEIEKIQQLAEIPLPSSYVDYLSQVGVSDGGLTWGYAGMDMRIENLINYYESTGWRPPRPYLLIGRDAEARPWSTYLRCTEAGEAWVVQFNVPDGPSGIVDAPDGDVQSIAPTLAQLLFRCAFTNLVCYEFNYESYGRILQPRPEDAQAIAEGLRGHGCHLHPFSARGEYYYLSSSSAVQCIQSTTDQPMLIYVYSDDSSWIESVQSEFSRRVSLQTYWLEETAVVHLGSTDRPARGYFKKSA